MRFSKVKDRGAKLNHFFVQFFSWGYRIARKKICVRAIFDLDDKIFN